MKKVAFLVADGFEDSEMQNPYEAMTKAGHEAVIISLERDAELKGKKGTVTYTSHLSASQAKASDYAAVIIPGGSSPEKLRGDTAIQNFVKEADRAGTPISAICHGPQVLASAGLLRDRTLTGYSGIQDEIRQAGGSFVDQEVVVDRNLVTSRSPKDEPAFIEETLNKIGVNAY
ncbi:type 1 glutamine amidotransferase domain-containing protein [Paenibacillus gansuensis]|uniref:Type 1 glutamine amidotransferase domain-containing protein n=1 Tax=Paenibacillus gansuensis TaxID=306542 RepID=A0ABW5PKK2_9BACL